jgi:hypothetical protein
MMVGVSMDELDEALRRARELFLSDPSDESDDEIEKLLPRLADARYVEVEEDRWGFTSAGRARAEELGFP